MPPYFAASREQTKIYSTTLTIMITVEIAKNLRLSQMIPTVPNTKAPRNESFPSRSPRAAIGLPQPGLSNNVALAVRTAARSNDIAIFPKRILTLP